MGHIGENFCKKNTGCRKIDNSSKNIYKIEFANFQNLYNLVVEYHI